MAATRTVLALDCSTDQVALSFCEGSPHSLRTLASRRASLASLSDEGPPNDALVCLLADFLGDIQRWLPDIDVWAAGTGPGPGPWISESLAFMRRMAGSMGRPLWSMSSLKSIALGAFYGQAGLGAVVVPVQPSSTPGKLWAGAYRRTADDPNAPIEAVLEDREYRLDELRAAIAKAKKAPAAKVRLRVPSLMISAPAWTGAGSGYFEHAAALGDLLAPLPPSELERPLLPSTFMIAHAALSAEA